MCYDYALRALRMILVPPQGSFVASLPADERARLWSLTLHHALLSSDELFHIALYRWLVRDGFEDRLLGALSVVCLRLLSSLCLTLSDILCPYL